MHWEEVRDNREWQLQDGKGGVFGTIFRQNGELFMWFSEGKQGETTSFDEARGQVERVSGKVGK